VTAHAAGRPRLVPPPSRELWRIGFRARPLAWRHARPLLGAPPTGELAGGRFDAPSGEFSTVYFASTQYGACLEKLAPLRPDIRLQDRIDAFLDEEPDPEHDIPFSLRVPSDFCSDHVFVSATVDPNALFVDVDATETHRALHERAAELSPELRALIEEHQMQRVDRGAFLSHVRPLTRHLALQLYNLYGHEANVIGLRFPSSLDPAAECWAVWDTGEPFVSPPDIAPVDFSNTSLRAAASRLGLTVPQH
jgi:hypothetical protein